MEEKINIEKEIRTYGDLAKIVKRLEDEIFEQNLYGYNRNTFIIDKMMEKYGDDVVLFALDALNELEYLTTELLKIDKNLKTKEDWRERKLIVKRINEIKAELDKEIEEC